MTVDPQSFGAPSDRPMGGSEEPTAAGTTPPAGSPADSSADSPADDHEQKSESQDIDVSSPAKVMRIGTMVKQLLEEVRSTDLDEKGRERLAQIHRRSIEELEDGLSKDLVDELERLDLPFDSTDGPPTTSELRVAQAQLVGWLEGLFHGIQTAIMAQQAMARQAMGQLPPGMAPPGAQQRPQPDRDERGPGNYL